MIKAETKGSINLSPLEETFIEIIAARTVARVSGNFVTYLKNTRFDTLFDVQTGETKGSIGAYRAKAKQPTYLIRAGLGVPGSMSYLKNLYKGRGKSRSGNWFNYAKKRDLIKEGWKAYDGESKMSLIFANELQKAIKEAEALLEKQ
jgi:hypothetical protein